MSKIKTNQPKPKPAYQRIKDSILESIHSGIWQAGEAIPTEFELADKLGVSKSSIGNWIK